MIILKSLLNSPTKQAKEKPLRQVYDLRTSLEN